MPHPYDELSIEDLRRRRSEKWQRYPPDVLPCWVAEMDFPLAEPIRAALHELVERGDCGYAHVDGVAEAYAGFSARRFGFAIDPARCYVVPDVMRGVLAALEVLTEPGDGVVVNPPVYPPFFPTIEYGGRRVVEVPLAHDSVTGRYHLDLDGLAAAFAGGARAYLLCNPHNPVGRTWERDTLAAVADLAERYDIVVLSDEVHGPLTYEGATFTPFGSLRSAAVERSVSLVSASKAWNVPGLKCAFAVAGSADVRKRFETLPEIVQVLTGIAGVVANQVAFAEGDDWLDDTLGYLDANRHHFGRLLAERLPGVRWALPEATYLGWLDLRGLDLDGEPSDILLERGKVALFPGPEFGRQGHGWVRMNLATSRAILTEAVDRIVAGATSN